MVKTQKSFSDVMAAGMNQSNKSHDLMTPSNMAAPRIPQIR